MKARILSIVLFFCAAFSAMAQLADFSMTLTTSDETCPSKGSVAIALNGATAGSTISYAIYTMPGEVPLDTFTDDEYLGLTAGDYRIIATQQLNGDSNTATADFSIQATFVPLQFSVSEPPVGACSGGTGSLLITVDSGMPPYSFEITSPVNIGPQTNPLFENLPMGEYVILVTDACQTRPITHFFVPQTNSPFVNAAGVEFDDDCVTVEVGNNITSTGVLIYPLEITYTIHYDAGDQTIQQIYGNGDDEQLDLSLSLSLDPVDDIFTYDLSVVDGCGTSATGTFIVDPTPLPQLNTVPNECGFKYVTLSVPPGISMPYTMQFLNPVAGFDPAALSTHYPGPTNETLVEFGSLTNTLPEGLYEVIVTDFCGRTGTASVTLDNDEGEAQATAPTARCETGVASITFSISPTRDITSIAITAAPPEYTGAVPNNISPATLPASSVSIAGFPPNATIPYLFTITDECGNVYTNVESFVKPFVPGGELTVNVRPSCTPSFGSIEVRSPNSGTELVSITITAAPANYPNPVPFDATALINSGGDLILGQLPPGLYSFTGVDSCNFTLSKNDVEVVGYDSGIGNATIDRNCGSFNFTVSDNGNIPGSSYWWQRQDPVTGEWGHPFDGTPYGGGVPDESNSVQVANGGTINNLTLTGTFRVVKVYSAFDGTGGNCLDMDWETFSFSNELEIYDIYSVDCDGANGSIYVDAIGVPPYDFEITGPVNIDNGPNPRFDGLVPGTYFLTVTDACGGSINDRVVNLGTLESLVVANEPSPAEILVCAEPGTTTHIFDLTEVNASILGSQDPDDYLITFHHSQPEADSGSNPIDTPQAYVNSSLDETIFVRIMHKRINVCSDTESFRLIIGQSPEFTVGQTQYVVCGGSDVRIFAGNGYDAYLWSDGSTAPYLDVTQPGSYTVTVFNVYGMSRCESDPQTITVDGSSVATLQSVDVDDWRENNTITVNVTGTGDYVYSLDGENYQASNIFDNLIPGIYMVYVRDEDGCGIISQEVPVLGYPKYFTPNADGYNDYWQVKLAYTQPGMRVYIFDRYAKLLTSFGADSSGWDGNYNGYQAPATDYWFLVEMPNGEVHRGHFALKR